MKRLVYILAMTLTLIACGKENGPDPDIIILDKVAESAASTNDDGSYILDLTLEGGGYDVNMCVKSAELKLTDGTYNVGTNGCTVNFNDGYVKRNVSGGNIEITSDNDIYTILISVKSRNTDYKFKYHGAVEFRTFQGSVIRNCSVSSTAMGQTMKYSIYLPVDYSIGESFPILYLLHGYGDENNAWLDKGNLAETVHRYEENGGRQMIVVCPDGLTSFYVGDFETYMYNELMPYIEHTYKFNGKRAVAGLSMGGYGSLYYWSKYPEMYCYAYAMSPAVDVNGTSKILANKDKNKLPQLTIETGIQDFTTPLSGITEFHNYLVSEGVNHEFITRDGSHDWKFWQECLPKVLKKCGEAFKD